MGQVATFELPVPPSVNHYYVRGYRGGVVIGKAGKLYRAAVESALKPLDLRFKGRLDVSIVYVPGECVSVTVREIEGDDPKDNGLDLDNLCKCLLDSLTHARVWKDDGKIDRLTLERSQ